MDAINKATREKERVCQLIQGDCLDVMKNIPDKSIDLILCDLPYGTTSCKWDTIIPFDRLWEQYKRILKKDGAVVLFGTQPFTSLLIQSNIKWFKYELIWHKSKSGSGFTAKYRPISKHENICIFAKGKTKYNPQMRSGEPYERKHTINETKINNHKIGFSHQTECVSINNGTRYPETVQFFQQKWRRQDQLHPTQKPVELLEYLIKTYSNEGDLVLDNCMGSGTTGVAALKNNRNFIGIELDENYFKIAQQRINAVLQKNQLVDLTQVETYNLIPYSNGTSDNDSDNYYLCFSESVYRMQYMDKKEIAQSLNVSNNDVDISYDEDLKPTVVITTKIPEDNFGVLNNPSGIQHEIINCSITIPNKESIYYAK